MGIKFKIDKNAQRTLGIKVQNGRIVQDDSVLIPEVRKEFRNSGVKPIRKAVLRDVTKGISPVEGEGKYEKYSKSYKEVISGKKHFRTVGGRVIPIDGPEPNLGLVSGTKRRSPVNLRWSGELLNALKVFTTGGFTERFRLVFDWRDFLADIHNRRGAGKKKVVRRMLPTKDGEQFNQTITDEILDRLNRAAKKIVKAFS